MVRVALDGCGENIPATCYPHGVKRQPLAVRRYRGGHFLELSVREPLRFGGTVGWNPADVHLGQPGVSRCLAKNQTLCGEAADLVGCRSVRTRCIMDRQKPPEEKSMTPERLRQIEELYHSVREREPGQRAAFLADACQGDKELRREVESLLASNAANTAFLEEPMREAVELLGLQQSGSQPARGRL